MFKKQYKIRIDAKGGFNVYFKNWFWPFWMFYDQAKTINTAKEWIDRDKQNPLYF